MTYLRRPGPRRPHRLKRLLCLAALFSATANANELAGRVTRVVDGDTLVVSDSSHLPTTVHLFGIDAPELAQEFGQQSRTGLSALALGQSIQAQCVEQDRYGHELCVVWIRGKDVGLEQIGNGMAWWNQKHALRQSPQTRSLYRQAEFNAKIRRFGLWRGKNPMPPWNWQGERLEKQ